MTGFGELARSVSTSAIRYFGGDRQVTLRRRHTLKNQLKGEPISSLFADGVQAAGAAVLALKGSAGLRGSLIAGCTLTIPGHAAPYTVGADVAASTAGKLVGVAISPALAAEVPTLTVVTIAAPAADRSVWALRGEQLLEDTENGRTTDRRVYHLVADDLAAPVEGDLILDGGDVFPVVLVRPVSPGGSPARWTVTVGDAA